MRHYIRCGPEGDLIGCDVRTFGWPRHADPRDPNTTDPVAQGLRKRGWTYAAYDCPCSRDVVTCMCPFNLIPNHYFNGKVLFPKPAMTVELDGSPIADAASLVAPNSTAQIVIHSSVPDGHTVVASDSPGPVSLLGEPKTLVFTGGVSTPLEVVGPPQGISGTITWKSKYVRELYLTITGWA